MRKQLIRHDTTPNCYRLIKASAFVCEPLCASPCSSIFYFQNFLIMRGENKKDVLIMHCRQSSVDFCPHLHQSFIYCRLLMSIMFADEYNLSNSSLMLIAFIIDILSLLLSHVFYARKFPISRESAENPLLCHKRMLMYR